MKLLNTLAILFLFSILISCNSDDDAAPSASTCKPKRLVTAHAGAYDSIQYIYNASDKLDKLLYYISSQLYSTDRLHYDSQGRLIKFTQQYYFSDKPYTTYQFTYNNEGKVEKFDMWGVDTDVTPLVTTFTYDTKGRLSTVTDVFYKTMYEYNEDDNVSKIFYTWLFTGQEYLGRENLSFDDRIRFFANVPELAILNTYVFKYEPSKNNVTSTVVYMPNPGVILGAAQNITYNLKYDENGMLTNNFLSYEYTMNGTTEINFKDFKYSCQ